MYLSESRHETLRRLLPFFLLVSVIVISSIHFFFFWDKDILNSKQAFYYLENGFSLLAPPDMDSGHPPLMGWLLAGLWKLFGVHLALGHLAMFPFAIGLVWQLYRFTACFVPEQNRYLVLLLIFIDTSLLCQLVILTGELILIFLFLLAVNSVLYRKYFMLTVSLLFLGISSSRGSLSCAVIGLFHLAMIFREYRLKGILKMIPRLIPIYAPAIVLVGGYLVYHYLATGWIGYDPKGDHWAQLFQRNDLQGAVRNLFIVFWRLIDFGRLFLWLAGGYFLILFLKKKIRPDDKIITLLLLLIISLLVYTPSMILYSGLLSHRYLIPVYIVFTLLIGYLLFEKTESLRIRRILYILIAAGLLSGNFWIYPDSIAKGWDATLAHIPYYKLRREMIRYLEEERIPFSEVGTEVPNNAPLRYIDLSDDPRVFPYKNLKTQKYIFYSNIYNMFSDEELDELNHNWKVLKEFRRLQVRVTLYGKD